MALLDNCVTGSCDIATASECSSSPAATLSGVGLSVSDYLCSCQDERPIWSYESPNRKWKHAFLRKLFFGNFTPDNMLGTASQKTFFTLKDVAGMPSKNVLSVSGKSVEFLTYLGSDYFTTVTATSTGTTLTVADSSIFAENMSVEIVNQDGSEDCCYSIVTRTVTGVPSATTITVNSAVSVAADTRVIVRFSEVKKCAYFEEFTAEREATKFESYFQTLGHNITFDPDDLNKCSFSDFNDVISTALYGQKLKNQYMLKVHEMLDLFEHEILMAINTGINRAMTISVAGETLGIETAMAYARNTLNIENEYVIQGMSPRAIFQSLLDLVIEKQRSLSGSGNYIVGVTNKLYARIRNNQEYLRNSGQVQATSSGGVYKVGMVSIDTGYGMVEFMIDPYLELVYKEKMIARFLPDETTKFYTPMNETIDFNGNLVSFPKGLKVEDLSILNVGKAGCDITHAYSYTFAFVPGDALTGGIFKVEIRNA